MLNPTIAAYSKSEVDAPKPVISPCQRPRLSVRWMVSMPNGPTGTEVNSPMMNPLMTM